MPQYDRGRDRDAAGAQAHDLALAGFGERSGCASDEASIAFVLLERGATPAFPAAGLEFEECFERGGHILRSARDDEGDRAMLRQPIALTAQLLQLLRAERVAQQL